MAGLLYKDFVAIHGKIYVMAMFIITALLAGLALVPVSWEPLESVVLIVMGFMAMLFFALPIMVCMVLESNIISVDDGKRAYILSFPITKRQYIASKYVFVLICYYVLLSVAVLWVSLLNVPMESYPNNILSESIGLLPGWMEVCMLATAVELPFFAAMGEKAAKAAKTTILFGLFFLILVYMLFGDLTILDNFNLGVLVEYLKEHVEVSMALQVIGPIITGIVYYLSYRISVVLFERKEPEEDE